MRRPRINRLGSVLALLALAGMLGAHWPILKTLAWGRMLVTYSSDYGLRAGIVRTFNGQNPCSMCCAIKQGRLEERTRGKTLSQSGTPERVRAITFPSPLVYPALDEQIQNSPGDLGYRSHEPESPPVPPPRAYSLS